MQPRSDQTPAQLVKEKRNFASIAINPETNTSENSSLPDGRHIKLRACVDSSTSIVRPVARRGVPFFFAPTVTTPASDPAPSASNPKSLK